MVKFGLQWCSYFGDIFGAKSASWRHVRRHYSRNQEMVETAPVRSYYTLETTLELIMRLGGDRGDAILETVQFELQWSSYIGDNFGAKICVLETFLETLQPKSRWSLKCVLEATVVTPYQKQWRLDCSEVPTWETFLELKSASWRHFWRHYSRNHEMVEAHRCEVIMNWRQLWRQSPRLGGENDNTILEMVKFGLQWSSYFGDIFGAKICVLETFLETFHPYLWSLHCVQIDTYYQYFGVDDMEIGSMTPSSHSAWNGWVADLVQELGCVVGLESSSSIDYS